MTIGTEKAPQVRSFPTLRNTMLRLMALLALTAIMTGCSQLGELISNEEVADADNDQVISIGDSIFALSGEIQDNLQANAGETFRQYTKSGAYLVGGIGIAPSVVEQYSGAREDNANISTVIMDGGGNDILIPAIAFDPQNCKTQWYQFGHLSSKCKAFIDDIYVEAVNFLNEMDADGVDNVVYLGYYYTKNGILFLDSMEEAVDYGNQALARACRNSTVNCTFVDPRSTIVDDDILFDGIHPKSSGSQKLADLIWPELQPLL